MHTELSSRWSSLLLIVDKTGYGLPKLGKNPSRAYGLFPCWSRMLCQCCVQLTYEATKLVKFAQFGKYPSIPMCFVLQKWIPHLSASLPKLYYCHSDYLIVFFWLNVCFKNVWPYGVSTASEKGCGGLGDFEVTLPCSQTSVWSRRTLEVFPSLCVSREKARQASMPTESKVKVVFGKWHSCAEKQHFPVQPHPSACGIAPWLSGASCSHWHFTQEDHKGLLCQQRTKYCQCSLMKSKKEGKARATLILGCICLFSLGSWVEKCQKSQKDIPQFLRPTLNAQSLNFIWSIDSWCEGMSVFPSGVTGGTLTWSF